MIEPARRGELEREIRPMDMVCPQMGAPGSKSPNYWQSQCVARQKQRVCKCPVGRKVLEAAEKAARDRAERDAAAREEKEKAMPKVEAETEKPRCGTPGCWEPVLAKGLCKSCYWKMKGAERREKKRLEKEEAASKIEPQEQKSAVIVDEDTGQEGADAPTRKKQKPTKEKKTVRKEKRDPAERNHLHEFSIRIFDRDKDLLDDLTEASERERRSLSAEVLCRLERLRKIAGGQ